MVAHFPFVHNNVSQLFFSKPSKKNQPRIVGSELHTGAKILSLSKNSHFENLIFHKNHNFKVSFFTKFTFWKSHFSQNSQVQNLNFSQKSQFQSLIIYKIHIFKVSFLTKFTFLKVSFFTKIHIFSSIKFLVISG